MQNKQNDSRFLRVIKGMFIGAGFIVPGISGGALAAVFGIYEPLIGFISNITKDFWKNIKYFIWVGIGALISIYLLSFGVSFMLEDYRTISLWFFVGAIVGTLPSLWQEAGAKGRDRSDYITLILSFAFGLIFLAYGSRLFDGQVQESFGIWVLCGALIALGTLVPGLSPSNFIEYMGLYKAMSDGFKNIDFSIIIPLAIGMLVTLLSLAKVIERIYQKHYAKFYHFILGIVLASTVMIIPTDYAGFKIMDYIYCIISLAVGILISNWMTKLEEKYA